MKKDVIEIVQYFVQLNKLLFVVNHYRKFELFLNN